jgi:hypothetical protein
MRARYHVIASAGISLGFQAAMHSWPATLGCFLSGILIDVDHYLEYYIVRKEFPFQYKDLVKFCMENKQKKLYLVFHAYEYLILLWFSIFFFSLGKIWIGIAVGLTTHLIFDQFTNPIKPLFYFLTFRIKNKFETIKMTSEEYSKRGGEYV